jgi:hypothetical protein
MTVGATQSPHTAAEKKADELERARIGGSVIWWGGGFFDVFEGERFQFGDQFSEAAGVVQ